MGSKKDRSGMDLTEAEDIKKRRQEYTEELYKKDLHDPGNHNGVITHLEPDILEWEVKWALGKVKVKVKFLSHVQLFATHGLPGSSVHGIFQAIVLEWIGISFSKGSSQPRDWTQVSCIADWHFSVWATREVPGGP